MSALSLHLTPSTVARRARKGWFARLINALQEFAHCAQPMR